MKHLYVAIFWFCLSVGMHPEASAQRAIPVQQEEISEQITIFPNPASELVTIKTGNLKIKRISISNIVGKEILRLQATTDHTYNIENLKRGIYIVRLFDNEDQMIKAVKLSKS